MSALTYYLLLCVVFLSLTSYEYCIPRTTVHAALLLSLLCLWQNVALGISVALGWVWCSAMGGGLLVLHMLAVVLLATTVWRCTGLRSTRSAYHAAVYIHLHAAVLPVSTSCGLTSYHPSKG